MKIRLLFLVVRPAGRTYLEV